MLAWILAHFSNRLAPHNRNPVRSAILVMWVVLLLTFVLGMARGIGGIEQSAANRSVLAMASFTGVALIALDGIASRQRLDAVIRWLVYGVGFISFVGFLQFGAGIDLAPRITFPPLVLNSGLIPSRLRGDALRVTGTAGHPIEFGVIGAMVLPLAVHFWMQSISRRQRVLRAILAALIATAIPFSGSRSAWLGLAGGVFVLARVWKWRVRLNAAVVGVLGLGAIYATSPGTLTTMRYLILNLGNDPSVQGRTDDYAVVLAQVRDRPFFGRGFGTYIPEIYRVLDNQLLMLLVSVGIIGTIAVLHVFTASWRSLSLVAEEATLPETRHLAYVLKAGIISGLLASLTFDSFSFVSFAGIFFILVGLSGALIRLHCDAGETPPTDSSRFSDLVRQGSFLPHWVPKRRSNSIRGRSWQS